MCSNVPSYDKIETPWQLVHRSAARMAVLLEMDAPEVIVLSEADILMKRLENALHP